MQPPQLESGVQPDGVVVLPVFVPGPHDVVVPVQLGTCWSNAVRTHGVSVQDGASGFGGQNCGAAQAHPSPQSDEVFSHFINPTFQS